MISARSVLWIAFCAAALSRSGAAQVPEIRVYSEFQRVDPFGKVVPPDQPRRAGVKPREILSPAVARNAHSCFRAAITLPPGGSYTLYVAQNPDDVFGFALYREIYTRQGNGWIPDAIEPVEIPARGTLAPPHAVIPGQTTVSYLLDIWTPAARTLSRARVELQLYDGQDWYIYPMEVRIVSASVPAYPIPRIILPAAADPADATARRLLQSYVCGSSAPSSAPDTTTLRGLLARSVAQDVAVARALENKPGARLLPEILRLAGKAEADASRWCSEPAFPEDLGPEWYLRLRDAILRWAE